MLAASDPIREAVVGVLMDGIEGLDGVEEVLDGDGVGVVGLDIDGDGTTDALLVGVEGEDGTESVEVFLVDEDPGSADDADDAAEPVEVLLVDTDYLEAGTDASADGEGLLIDDTDEDDLATGDAEDEEPELIDEVMAETDYLQDAMADGTVTQEEIEGSADDTSADDEAPVEDEAVAEDAVVEEEPELVAPEETEPTRVAPEDGEVLNTIDTTGDGYSDVRLIDTTGDGHADTVMGDLNDDGYQDINARDMDGNSTLDEGEGLENMELLTRGAVASDSIDMIERQNDELDSDEDGVTNVQEHDVGMNTLDGDMDRDGVGDGVELNQGSDPDAYLSSQPIEDVAEHAAWEASVEAESWESDATYDAGLDAGYDAGADMGYDAGAADYDTSE